MPIVRNALPNLDTLALFVAIVEDGSLSAAARKLGVHQPNASRALKQLERELGVTLVTRSTTGTVPTEAGRQFAERARVLLNEAAYFSNWCNQLTSTTSAQLEVVASMTISEFLLPRWLTAFAKDSPGVKVTVDVGNSTHVLQNVEVGKAALGFIETTLIPTRVNKKHLGGDYLLVVVAPGHPWAERTSKVSLEELAATPLVTREAGSGTRESFTEILARHLPGVPIAEPAHVVSSNAAVRIAVQTGSSPAVLSQHAVQAQLDNGTLLQVPTEIALGRPLTAVWKGDLTPAARALINVAATSFPTMR